MHDKCFTTQVVSLVSTQSYVALRLLKDSVECRQFSQLCILIVLGGTFPHEAIMST